MKGLLLALFFAVSAAAQTPVAHVHADGVDVDVAAAGEADVIVEFQQPPLAIRAAPLQSFRDTFGRFRTDLGAIEGRVRAAKTAVDPVIDYEYFEAFHGAAIHTSSAVIRDLQLLPYVKRVHANHAVQAFDDASNTLIGADRVWSTLGARGKGVVVAIIDTGIDYNHPAFGGRVIGGYDFVKKTNDPLDDNGHGTHVAGIVGASSSVVSGVAPEVSFLAYKVLDAKGSGRDSDVIAGLERALDPNGDGNLSDHADVANLSLGSGAGNPDDAGSTAVDNAVAAGMIVCVAAGNAGDYDRIGSPGMARNAITVGASDNNDLLAGFSSRGPCAKLASIKPDVVAPGVSILSTLPNNTYGRLSGTSMATPQVTGAAALLRSLHRDWTPAQVKSALMATSAVLSYDAMSVGAGRIDVFRAAAPAVWATPPQLSFGLDATNLTTFKQTATVAITNLSSAARTFVATVAGAARNGVVLSVSPTSIDVPANESRNVDVTLTVTNAAAGAPPAGSQSFSGFIVFGDGRTPAIDVPWAVVKATRTTVTYDLPEAAVLWWNNGRAIQPVPLDDKTFEMFAQPGDYDLLVASASQAAPGALADLQAVFVESQHLDGDVALPVASSSALHRLDFEATDESGKRLGSYDTRSPSQLWYLNRSRIFSSTGAIHYIELSASGFATMNCSELSDRYTIEPSETFVDFVTRRVFQAQHRTLTGVHQGETLAANLGDYVHIRPTLAFPSDGPRRLFAYTPVVDRVSVGGVSPATSTFVSGRAWTPDVWLTPSPDPDRSDSFAFQINSDGTFPEYIVPPLRVIGGKVIGAFPFVPSMTAFAASQDVAFTFGGGPLYAKVFVHPLTAAASTASVQIYGLFDELRVRDATNALYTVTDANGKVVQSGLAAKTSIVLPALPAGAYRFDYDIEPLSIGDRLARGTLTSTFDTSRTDASPPSITSLSLRDAHDRPVSHLDAGASASIVFSAADSQTTTYAAVDNRATKLSIRVEGQPDWQPLKLTQIGEDADVANGRPAPGLIDRADLPPIPDGALVDVKIEIADPAGNATSWTLAPAFTVGNAPPFPGKRRRP